MILNDEKVLDEVNQNLHHVAVNHMDTSNVYCLVYFRNSISTHKVNQTLGCDSHLSGF